MFAGTSIGGLIALILSQKKYSAEELLKHFSDEALKIYLPERINELNYTSDIVRELFVDVRTFLDANTNNNPKEKITDKIICFQAYK
jgi:patatin-like phospholipase/acyl hydrolase